MKTIEIKQKDLKANKRLVKKIYGLIGSTVYMHFLYEPELIIRTENAEVSKITDYLKKRDIGYRVYAYPFGKGYGEGQKSVVYKYRRHFLPLMGINSSLAVELEPRHRGEIIERLTHVLMNTFGYEWIDESSNYLKLAWQRIWLIRKYESQTLAGSLVCGLSMQVISFNISLLKLLK